MTIHLWEIHCPRCNGLVAKTSSTQPLPGIYHPECAEAEKDEEEVANEKSSAD
jgi:hypothetical protein